jgi:hypothetical protein
MSSLRIDHAEPDFLLLRWRTILVTLYRGPLVARHLEIVRPVAYELIREAAEGGALLSIFASGASEAGQESRAAAAELFEDAGRALRAVAIVYEGAGQHAAALVERSRDVVARAGLPSPVAAFTALAPAATWLFETSRLITDPGEPGRFVQAIEQARRTH